MFNEVKNEAKEWSYLWVFWFILILVVGSLGFVANYVGYVNMSFVEQWKNDIFHNSQAYTDGQIKQLNETRHQYNQSHDEGEKAALKAYARTQLGSFDCNKMPSDLTSFCLEVKE